MSSVLAIGKYNVVIHVWLTLIISRFLDKRPLINDDLPGQVLHGLLVMKPTVKDFKDSGVVFEDGTVEENIDTVIFCTGYKTKFPFLPASLSEGPNKEFTLYK